MYYYVFFSIVLFVLFSLHLQLTFAARNQLASGPAGLYINPSVVNVGGSFECYVYPPTRYHNVTCLITTNNLTT